LLIFPAVILRKNAKPIFRIVIARTNSLKTQVKKRRRQNIHPESQARVIGVVTAI
jgi:hypothetical protein